MWHGHDRIGIRKQSLDGRLIDFGQVGQTVVSLIDTLKKKRGWQQPPSYLFRAICCSLVDDLDPNY